MLPRSGESCLYVTDFPGGAPCAALGPRPVACRAQQAGEELQVPKASLPMVSAPPQRWRGQRRGVSTTNSSGQRVLDGFNGDGHPQVLLSVPSCIKGLSCRFSPGLCVGNRWAAHALVALPGSLGPHCTARLGRQQHPGLWGPGSWVSAWPRTLGSASGSALGTSRWAPELVTRQSGDAMQRMAATSAHGGRPGTLMLKVKLRRNLGISVQKSNPGNLFSAGPNLGGI